MELAEKIGGESDFQEGADTDIKLCKESRTVSNATPPSIEMSMSMTVKASWAVLLFLISNENAKISSFGTTAPEVRHTDTAPAWVHDAVGRNLLPCDVSVNELLSAVREPVKPLRVIHKAQAKGMPGAILTSMVEDEQGSEEDEAIWTLEKKRASTLKGWR